MNESLSILPNDLVHAHKIALSQFTFARIGLEKVGTSISMKEVLKFRAAHAATKDALFTPFDTQKLKQELESEGLKTIELSSATKDKNDYLQRPDLGRMLNQESVELLLKTKSGFDVCIIISDGLSASAANSHALPLIKLLYEQLNKTLYTIAPIILLNRGRVATSDQIGEILNTKLSLILVGERPGLSSPDSLGAYLTYQPQIGKTDESRNCVSNIRPQGLNYHFAAEKLVYFITNSITRKISGVELKDEMGQLEY